MMNRYRIRIRFRKEDDLRLISHRDLVRAFERTFRRASLRLAMSEGFHPKPRMTFPSALALGVRGLNEVMELELAEETPTESLLESLQRHAPPGLVVTSVTPMQPGQRKGRVRSYVYEFPAPSDRQVALLQAVGRLRGDAAASTDEPCATAAGLPGLENVELADGVIRFTLAAESPGSARPRDVLAALELDDLQIAGAYLTRTQVELTP